MKKRVLVVDDDPDILEGLRELLGATYDVLVAADGREALDVLEREHVDALVLDLMMPGVSGDDVLRELRRRPDAPPAVVLSARTDARALAAELGAAACLGKPFPVDELERALAHVLAS